MFQTLVFRHNKTSTSHEKVKIKHNHDTTNLFSVDDYNVDDDNCETCDTLIIYIDDDKNVWEKQLRALLFSHNREKIFCGKNRTTIKFRTYYMINVGHGQNILKFLESKYFVKNFADIYVPFINQIAMKFGI